MQAPEALGCSELRGAPHACAQKQQHHYHYDYDYHNHHRSSSSSSDIALLVGFVGRNEKLCRNCALPLMDLVGGYGGRGCTCSIR